MRVLLLNPPGRRIYVRDYFCSKTTKSGYLFHPIDLVMLSGTLAQAHDVAVLDCLAERLSPERAHRRVAELCPEVVVALVGSVSWEEDRRFLSELARPGRRVLAIGDVLQERSEARLAEEPWLEAALHDFANADALHYLAGERERVVDMTVRDARGEPQRLLRARARARGAEYRVPRPRHELFPERGYSFSFARSRRFATLLTDYGCPYPCTFCVIGTLGFRTRPVADVLEEVDHLRARGMHAHRPRASVEKSPASKTARGMSTTPGRPPRHLKMCTRVAVGDRDRRIRKAAGERCSIALEGRNNKTQQP